MEVLNACVRDGLFAPQEMSIWDLSFTSVAAMLVLVGRGFRGAPLVLAAMTLAGCGSDLLRRLTDPSSASVVLIGVGLDGPRVEAADLSSQEALRLELSAGDADYYALGYNQPLAELGLVPGPLAVNELGRTLPRADRTQRLQVIGGVPGEWRGIEVVPPVVEAIKLAALDPCVRFEARYFNLPESPSEEPLILQTLDEEHGLLVASGGGIFRVGAGTVERLEAQLPPGKLAAGSLDGQGRMWLAQVTKGVLRGPPLSAPERLPTRKIGDLVMALAVPQDSEGTECFAATSSVGIEHFDGLQWRALRQPSRVPLLPFRVGAVWMRPGHAAVIGSAPQEVVEVDVSGEVLNIAIPLAEGDGFVSARWVPGLGPTLGTRHGLIFTQVAGAWRPLEQPAVLDSVYLVVPLASGGFFGGGNDGEFGQWVPGYGACGLQNFSLGRHVFSGTSLGRDVLLATKGHELGFDMSLAYLQARPR